MAKKHKYRKHDPDYKERVNTRLGAWRRRKLAQLSEAQNHRCAYCCRETFLGTLLGDPPNNKPLHLKATLDHIVPKSTPVQTNKDSNLIMACSLCNSLRSDDDPYKFYERLRCPAPPPKKKKITEEKKAKQERKKARGLVYAFYVLMLFPEQAREIIRISELLAPKRRPLNRHQQIARLSKVVLKHTA